MNSVILTGFSGTGKSRIGRLLAQRLSFEFLDLDDLIAERAGLPVPAIFDRWGEPRFRAFESEAIRSLASRSSFVLATGGGAMANTQNSELLRLSGCVVLLQASPTVLLQRLASGERRPMLENMVRPCSPSRACRGTDDPLGRVKQLLRQRKPSYALADYSVNTSRISPEVAADRIEALYRRWLSEEALDLPLQRDPYRIHIKDGLVRQAGERMGSLGLRGKALVLTDRNVARHYAPLVTRGLEKAGFDFLLLSVPPGERSKSRSQAWKILDQMAAFNMTRDATVVALGGGVVGDLAGFVAALYMRGLNLVQIPTSLLAQVDSSVGGKVAIDHPRGKNLLGAFFQPRLVLIDPLCLRTLPLRELRCGLAEVVKYGAIADEAFFSHLEDNAERLLCRDSAVLRPIIRRCCQIKAQVVLEDERETLGKREVLNFGHTFGHALEAALRFSRIKHGEAVSIGMVAAARLSAELGLVSREVPLRLSGLLTRLGLPTSAQNCPPQACLNSLSLDKKARAGSARFVLLNCSLGNTTVVTNPPLEAVTRALQSMCGSA